jgi:hypothetical protein
MVATMNITASIPASLRAIAATMHPPVVRIGAKRPQRDALRRDFDVVSGAD